MNFPSILNPFDENVITTELRWYILVSIYLIYVYYNLSIYDIARNVPYLQGLKFINPK